MSPEPLWKGGLVAGIFFLATWVFSIGAIVQKNHVTMGLILLNWVLIVDALAVLVIGTILWFFSLRQRNEYHVAFQAASAQTRIAIQNKVSPTCGHPRRKQ